MIDQPLKVGVGRHLPAMTAINFPKYLSGGSRGRGARCEACRSAGISRTREQKQKLQDWSSCILRGFRLMDPVGLPTSGRNFPNRSKQVTTRYTLEVGLRPGLGQLFARTTGERGCVAAGRAGDFGDCHDRVRIDHHHHRIAIARSLARTRNEWGTTWMSVRPASCNVFCSCAGSACKF
jgi:hypothetical protein